MGIISIKNQPRIIVLGIESTAHTFGVSITDSENGIISDVKDVYSSPPGSGIHPREASRHHSRVASKVVDKALRMANVSADEVDAIAYSAGPGLGPCLRVGGVVARTLASYLKKPLMAVNHAIGHIELAAHLTNMRDPVVLLATGGHTLIATHDEGRWRIFGETLDITLGQLLDQFGRTIGLSSPAGPQIEDLASSSQRYIELPYTVKGNDLSLSGVLTSAKMLYRKGAKVADLAYSVQETAFAMVVETCERALAFLGKEELLLTGGVAANKRFNSMLSEACKRFGFSFNCIPRNYSGDCGAQIAWLGILDFWCGNMVQPAKAGVVQSWRLSEVDTPWRS